MTSTTGTPSASDRCVAVIASPICASSWGENTTTSLPLAARCAPVPASAAFTASSSAPTTVTFAYVLPIASSRERSIPVRDPDRSGVRGAQGSLVELAQRIAVHRGHEADLPRALEAAEAVLAPCLELD